MVPHEKYFADNSQTTQDGSKRTESVPLGYSIMSFCIICIFLLVFHYRHRIYRKCKEKYWTTVTPLIYTDIACNVINWRLHVLPSRMLRFTWPLIIGIEYLWLRIDTTVLQASWIGLLFHLVSARAWIFFYGQLVNESCRVTLIYCKVNSFLWCLILHFFLNHCMCQQNRRITWAIY